MIPYGDQIMRLEKTLNVSEGECGERPHLWFGRGDTMTLKQQKIV